MINNNKRLTIYNSHRHVVLGIYYHALSMIEMLRDPDLDPVKRERYEKQVDLHEKRLNQFSKFSEVNYRLYHTILVNILYICSFLFTHFCYI